jgi:hypothetical protein
MFQTKFLLAVISLSIALFMSAETVTGDFPYQFITPPENE